MTNNYENNHDEYMTLMGRLDSCLNDTTLIDYALGGGPLTLEQLTRRNIDMDKLEALVDRAFAIFNSRAMVEV